MLSAPQLIRMSVRRMADSDGAHVTEVVYSQLYSGDSSTLDPDTVAYALDDAMQALRAEGLAPERWAPFMHLGV